APKQMNDWPLGRFLRGSDRTLPARWKQPAFLPSLNVKTARSWRGIVALRTSHGRGACQSPSDGGNCLPHSAAWVPLGRSRRVRSSRPPVVGFLNAASPDGYVPMVAAFCQGLKEVG